MNIIVPMAGIGSRLRPHTLTIPKPLTLIAGKPIVQRLVEDIVKVVDQKVEEIAFIIGPTFPADTEERLLEIAKGLGAIGKVFVTNARSIATMKALAYRLHVGFVMILTAYSSTWLAAAPTLPRRLRNLLATRRSRFIRFARRLL